MATTQFVDCSICFGLALPSVRALKNFDSPRTTPFARYAYGRISENYRRVFEGRVPCAVGGESPLPIRYRELQLLTDMIAGMTDQFAVDLHRELREFYVGASSENS